MTYSDFIKIVSLNTGLSKKLTKDVMDAATQVLRESVGNNHDVVLKGIGKFSKKIRSARVGINPRTSEKVNVPEMNCVTFRISKAFKNYLNS